MKRCIAIMLGLLLPLGLLAQHEWTVNTTAYESNMTLVIQVQLNGELNPNLEIGAFSGLECRGIAAPQYENALQVYLWYLTVFGTNNDVINFYVREKDVELEAKADYVLNFQPNGIIGNPMDPQIINFVLEEPYGCVTHESSRELSASPAPVDRNQPVNVSFPATEEERRGLVAEVYRFDGGLVQVVRTDCVPMKLDPLKVAGTYMVRVTLGTGKMLTGKIVVK